MLSAVVLTKNEGKSIRDCLKCLKWCDEIIVVDDYSQDSTLEIAPKYRAHVYRRHLNNDFSAQRNYGLEKAKGEWVLFIDADERVTDALASEITNYKLQITNYKGFFVKRRDVIWSKELHYGEIGNIKLLRLARKGAGKWRRRVHEYWDIKGEVGELTSSLLHFPHQTITEFLQDINFYSTLHARQKYEDSERSNLIKILFWPIAKFIKNWILLRGFLDGAPGFVVAQMMSFHSFLAWSKLWLMQKK